MIYAKTMAHELEKHKIIQQENITAAVAVTTPAAAAAAKITKYKSKRNQLEEVQDG